MLNTVMDYPARNRVGPPRIVAEIEELLSFDEASLFKSDIANMLFTLIRQHPILNVFEGDSHAAQTVPGLAIHDNSC